jgi:hypothetical protein
MENPNYQKIAEEEIKEYTPLDINSELWFLIHKIDNLIPTTEENFSKGDFRSAATLFETIRTFAILIRRYSKDEKKLEMLERKVGLAKPLLFATRQGKMKSAEMLLELCIELHDDAIKIMDESQKLEKIRRRGRI